MASRVRMGRAVAVKNKAPAPQQTTAEQLLREAMERVEAEPKKPRQKITDAEELADYRLSKRKEFENKLRRQRLHIGVWCKYALWEARQHEFDRARSIFERALEVDYQNPKLYLTYAEMEMEYKFVNHARNIWDRAVSLLPRVDQLWYKYIHMEEMLGNVANARQIYERWMEWRPSAAAWKSFVKFERRHKQTERARNVFERFIVVHQELDTYLKYAEFEEKLGQVAKARVIFERSVTELGELADENLFVKFAEFEERQKEVERARSIYKHALDNVPKHKVAALYNQYAKFEKQHGDRVGVEEVVLAQRRYQYEEDVKNNPFDYDTWFDYIRLEESVGDKNCERIRDVYERAISNIPLIKEKRFWRRYIYLWINYALYEELNNKDKDRTRQVYQKCLEIVPHQLFTFSKIWVNFALFEIRNRDVTAARQILGTAIGKCPKEKIFRAYIEIEEELFNYDRCRKLYSKFLELMPANCHAWVSFAQFEIKLSEFDRARKLYELAVNQPELDMPEVLWKSFIDFEISQQEHERVRALYQALLTKTKHVKVWISRAQFEATLLETDLARTVFQEADAHFKAVGAAAKEERVLLLEAWRDFERVYGTEKSYQELSKKMPRRIRSKRLVKRDEEDPGVYEEFTDYIFPDEESKMSTLALLEAARRWKKKKAVADSGDVADMDVDDNVTTSTSSASVKQANDSAPEQIVNKEEMNLDDL